MISTDAECAVRDRAARSAAPRILVVDDDPDYALLVEEALQDKARFAVTVAATAREAREHGYEQFNAIVLDQNLPDAAGLDMLPEIIGSCESPVIMLTGENIVETAVKAIQGGAFSYVVKTAENLDVLPEIVGQAVEEAGRREERGQMQAQMRRAEALAGLGSLANGMCHEMNNPLAAIMGSIDLYRHGMEDDVERCMGDIWKSACRLRDVVRSLASFAYGAKPPRDTVDVLAVLGEQLDEQRDAMANAGVSVASEFANGELAVTGNGPALEQVLRHLLVNARLAVEDADKKALTIKAARAQGRVRVEVHDTGSGVPEDIRGRIFDPFFTTRDPDKGMGMGLAISHRIIEDHGGRLWHEPGRDGGAAFIVEIPAAADAADTRAASKNSGGGQDA